MCVIQRRAKKLNKKDNPKGAVVGSGTEWHDDCAFDIHSRGGFKRFSFPGSCVQSGRWVLHTHSLENNQNHQIIAPRNYVVFFLNRLGRHNLGSLGAWIIIYSAICKIRWNVKKKKNLKKILIKYLCYSVHLF